MTRRHLTLALHLAIALPAVALAKGRAETLFDAGRALMSTGRYAEACSKFSESESLEPAAGTLLNLADCQEHLELPADALKTFEQAAQLAAAGHQEKREAVARARAAKLVPQVGTLAIHVEPTVALEVDDAPVALPEAAAGVVVNPGLHKVLAVWPKGHRWSRAVGPIAAGKRLEVDVPPDAPVAADIPRDLEPAPPPPASTAASASAPGVASTSTAVEPSGLRRAAPFLITGGGLVFALGVTGIVHSLSVSHAVSAQQPGGPSAATPTVTRADIQQLAWMYPASVGAAVAGAGLVGLGIYGFVSPQGGGAGVAGHF
jgi:hypothetical protein